jgi:hypothetical protein
MNIDLVRPLSELYLISGNRIVLQHSSMVWKISVIHYPVYRYDSNEMSHVDAAKFDIFYADISRSYRPSDVGYPRTYSFLTYHWSADNNY